MAGTELERAACELGLRMAREIYADRAYDDTGNLVSRKLPGAVLHDPEEAAARVQAMVREGAIMLIEWPERAGPWAPPLERHFRLSYCDAPDAREVAELG